MESASSGRVQLPASFEDAPMDQLVQLIGAFRRPLRRPLLTPLPADMLNRLMAHNDQIPLLPESLTRFHSRSAPSISVLDYLKRIVRFTNVEKSCLLITLHYIDQMCARSPLFTLSSLTCHRFIIAAITVSSKGLCDTFCTNHLYAKVGGIPVAELNILEREFLSAIDWRLMHNYPIRDRFNWLSIGPYGHPCSCQCTREVLQEYYINLVRTHSAGCFVIVGADSPSDTSDSDAEMDSGQSHPPSPDIPTRSLPPRNRRTTNETSTILIEAGTNSQEVAPRPTIAQNMAFAALQQSQRRGGGI